MNFYAGSCVLLVSVRPTTKSAKIAIYGWALVTRITGKGRPDRHGGDLSRPAVNPEPGKGAVNMLQAQVDKDGSTRCKHPVCRAGAQGLPGTVRFSACPDIGQKLPRVRDSHHRHVRQFVNDDSRTGGMVGKSRPSRAVEAGSGSNPRPAGVFEPEEVR